MDFNARWIALTDKNKLHTFQDYTAPSSDFLVSAKTCNKMLKGAQCHVLEFTLPSTHPAPPIGTVTLSAPPEIQKVLKKKIKDVFAEPAGLPPHTDCDHHIHLVPRATPPNLNRRLVGGTSGSDRIYQG